jgi:hypothetical protein
VEWRYSYTIFNLGTTSRWIAVYPWGSSPTPGTHFIGGWLGSKAGLNMVEKTNISCPYQELNPDSSAIKPIT